MLIVFEKMEPDFANLDERGGLVQLVREGYRQINYIFSQAGSVRGGHYHQVNEELFYIISGKFELLLEEKNIKEQYVFKAGDMFKIPAGIKHTFTYLEDTMLISMYDKGVELSNGEMDIYR